IAPPPLSDLLDWRVPYVPLLAMICVSELSAAEALEPGLRLPRSRFLPSPEATANDDASRPMITADATTSVPFELVRSNLRNMGGKASLSDSCLAPPTGRSGQGCGPVSASARLHAMLRATARSGQQREDRPG